MKFDKQNLLLYAVTDRSWLGGKDPVSAGGGGSPRRRDHATATGEGFG